MKEIWESLCFAMLVCLVIYMFSDSKNFEKFVGQQVGQIVRDFKSGYDEVTK